MREQQFLHILALHIALVASRRVRGAANLDEQGRLERGVVCSIEFRALGGLGRATGEALFGPAGGRAAVVQSASAGDRFDLGVVPGCKVGTKGAGVGICDLYPITGHTPRTCRCHCSRIKRP